VLRRYLECDGVRPDGKGQPWGCLNRVRVPDDANLDQARQTAEPRGWTVRRGGDGLQDYCSLCTDYHASRFPPVPLPGELAAQAGQEVRDAFGTDPSGRIVASLLCRNGYYVLQQIKEASDRDLLDIRGFGPQRLAWVRAVAG
jgi:hypothetical protein